MRSHRNYQPVADSENSQALPPRFMLNAPPR